MKKTHLFATFPVKSIFLFKNRVESLRSNSTKFLTHGFLSSGSSSWILDMKNAFLKHVNVTYNT